MNYKSNFCCGIFFILKAGIRFSVRTFLALEMMKGNVYDYEDICDTRIFSILDVKKEVKEFISSNECTQNILDDIFCAHVCSWNQPEALSNKNIVLCSKICVKFFA